MKFSYTLLWALAFSTIMGCSDDDSSSTKASSESSSSKEENKLDCTVANGENYNIVSPKTGEKFSIGDTVSLVFGTKIEDSGFRVVYATSDEDRGIDMFDESQDAVMDGKTCNTYKVVLSDNDNGNVKASKTASLSVMGYVNTSKRASVDIVVSE
ncbi:MAG: hypothetical protein HUK21_06635 [Fibrobacteraceae bacterium]|nr:hypothetical protein [Fibrobacteraceae bacterium]